MNKTRTVETTLGNLIAALIEETSAYVRDEKEACRVVAFMLTHLLSSRAAIRSSRYYN
ncbi:MAG: hypothetical protein ACREP3_19680 [Candidatus Binatia bacterium]